MNDTCDSVALAGTITLTSPPVRQARSTSAISMRFSERIAIGPGWPSASSEIRALVICSTREAAWRQLTVRVPSGPGIWNSTLEP